MDQDRVNEIGRWSEDKLSLLGKYLDAYTKIMKGQTWCRNGYHYIDAFAGTGRPKAKDEERYIDGSPRVALKVSDPFRSYIFIEKEDWRVDKLKRLQDEFPNYNIEIKQGNCNIIIVKEVVTQIRFENFNRGIIFLDPFGMDLEWETIEHIADTRALEIFLNFPAMAINPTTLVKEAYKFKPGQIERMNRFWGSPDWRDDLYEEVPTLFGPEIKKIPQTGKSLGELFRSRLNEVFSEVSDPLVMTNSRNAPLYCLIFAGHKESGKKIAQNIFARYERLGG